MVRLIISFLCFLGALFIYVIITNYEVDVTTTAAVFLTIIPLIFLAGANLVRISAFSSPRAAGHDYFKYVGALAVLVIIGISFQPMLDVFNEGRLFFGVWLTLLQLALLVTPVLKTNIEEKAKI